MKFNPSQCGAPLTRSVSNTEKRPTFFNASYKAAGVFCRPRRGSVTNINRAFQMPSFPLPTLFCLVTPGRAVFARLK